MRLPLALLTVLLASWASADRLVFTPKGSRVREGMFRGQWLHEASRDRHRAWLATGLGENLELELFYEHLSPSHDRLAGSLAYNFVLPITDISPGITFGVRDVLNQSEDGRAVYAAISYRFGNQGDLNQEVPTEVTIGVWSLRDGRPFVNLSVPFADSFRLLAEHDGLQPLAGVEIRPVRNLALQVLFQRQATLLGAHYSVQF